jgi:hypothetical protein
MRRVSLFYLFSLSTIIKTLRGLREQICILVLYETNLSHFFACLTKKSLYCTLYTVHLQRFRVFMLSMGQDSFLWLNYTI